MDPTHTGLRNRLLSALPPEEFSAIAARLQPLDLKIKHVCHSPGDRIEFAYFPTQLLISSVKTMEEGGTAEVGMVGKEGVLGLSLFLAADREARARDMVQLPGAGFRMPANDFVAAANELPRFRSCLLAYTNAVINQLAQTAACNRLHDMEQRCCKWLLMTQDQAESDTFAMTQEFMAEMLGVQRPTATLALGILEKAGLISHKRARVTVLDRDRLEGSACDCYRTIAAEFTRLYS